MAKFDVHAFRKKLQTPQPVADEVISGDISVTTGDTAAPTVPASPNALSVDGFARRRAEEVLQASKELAQELALGQDRQHVIEDFHTLAFEPKPEVVDHCQNAQRHKFVESTLETPAFHTLHVCTQLHEELSQLATHTFAREYAKLLQDQEERNKKREQRDKKRPPSKDQKAQDQAEDDIGTIVAATKALAEAQQEVDDYQEVERAFGRGEGAGSSLDPQKAASLFQRIRKNPEILRIMRLAGKFRNVARNQQRLKVNHGMEGISGMELSGDLPRVLAQELVDLVEPGPLGDLAATRLLDKSLMSWEWIGFEPKGQGPILVAIDESGSMQAKAPGMKDVTHADLAKAFALSLAWLARQQKRWCALVAWSSREQRRILVLPPQAWDEEALFTWLSEFCGGGTEPPLEDMPDIYAQTKAAPGKTDIILVTDGVCQLDEATILAFNTWKKKAQARMISLIINAQDGDIPQVSDEVHRVDSIDPNGNAAGRVLSI
jgi:uncharacterized protein with von Willebrand factor type A (vWA) domain